MVLYIHKWETVRRKSRDKLIEEALADYSRGSYKDPIIKREVNGKPFFENLPVHFSISHSGGIWACLMGDSNVGLDIQILKELKAEKLSRRFFTGGEASYVEGAGKEGFFEIWTRKEAYVKYTGKGFVNQNFSSFSLTEGMSLVDEFEREGQRVNFLQIKLPLDALGIETEERFFAAACVEKKEDLSFIRI